MNVRRIVAGSTVAVAAALALPALVQAAPVNPSQAVLAAHEFPFGSHGYKVEREKLSSLDGVPSEPTGGSQCETKVDAALAKLSGANVVEAEAQRGTTELEASIVDRSVTAATRDAVTACRGAVDPKDRPTVLAAPADLAHLRPFIFAEGASSLRAWADVRGVTVIVEAEGKKDAAVETEAFWQTLRAQVAKVERA